MLSRNRIIFFSVKFSPSHSDCKKSVDLTAIVED